MLAFFGRLIRHEPWKPNLRFCVCTAQQLGPISNWTRISTGRESTLDKNQYWCQALEGALEGQQETGYSVSDGEDAIDKFCSNPYMKVSNPATLDGNFYQFEEDADKSPEPDRLMNYGSTRIIIAASFFNTVTYTLPYGSADCPAEQDFVLADRQDDCKSALKTAMSSCK